MIEPKILIILNAEIAGINKSYFVEKNTGEFVNELKRLDVNTTVFWQFVEESKPTL